MNKKKIGELDGTPIVTGEKNYANEHEYYMTLNGDNTYLKLEQRTNGDLFKLVLGRGNSTNPGYNVTKQTVTLFNDTIETEDVGGGLYVSLVENIDFDLVAGENYTVVFDDTSYDIKATIFTNPFGDESIVLGEFNNFNPSFETYPFAIMLIGEEGTKALDISTNIEGSHTVEIKHEEETVTTTPEFKSAVDSVTGYSIDKENETFSTKTTPAFESMIQGIAGSTSGCQIIYPDSISWINGYSRYNKEPEAGNMYFIPIVDSANRAYSYLVYIQELIKEGNAFSGFAIIIGTPIIPVNGTLTVLDFDGVINPRTTQSGLQITYTDNAYRLSYRARDPFS